MKKRIHSIKLRRLIPLLILTLLSIICFCSYRSISKAFPSNDAAEKWQGNNTLRFTQIACFTSTNSSINEESVYSLRYSLESKLEEASIENPGNGNIYTDAYSAQSTLSVSSSRADASLNAIGVGGNFFFFHPLRLLSGSYISEKDLMQDCVILDEVAAWKLFGGTELAGLEITINDKPYLISGVVSLEQDKFTDKLHEDSGYIFMSYSAFYENCGVDISCYEIVLPNPVSNFGKNMVSEIFPSKDNEITEISGRFSAARILKLYKSFGTRSVKDNGIIMPYWENAQRIAEDYASLFMLLAFLLILYPAGFVIFILIRFIVKATKRGKHQMKKKVSEKLENYKERRYLKRIAAQTADKEEQHVDSYAE